MTRSGWSDIDGARPRHVIRDGIECGYASGICCNENGLSDSGFPSYVIDGDEVAYIWQTEEDWFEVKAGIVVTIRGKHHSPFKNMEEARTFKNNRCIAKG